MANNITVIIPIVDFVKNETLITEALQSVANNIELPQEVILVAHKSEKVKVGKKAKVTLPSFPNLNIRVVEHELEKPSYQAQINFAVKETSTEYFTILQLDDTLTKSYVKLLTKNLAVFPHQTIILPIIANVNADGFIGFQNEIIWANGFADVVGNINENLLLEFHDLFSFNGMCMRVDDFLEMGGLKESMKTKFDTEFLLRAIDNGNAIRVLPKVGYTHLNGREDSMTEINKKMSSEEFQFWTETALSEYKYNTDREIAFVKS